MLAMRWMRAVVPLALAGLAGCGSEDSRVSLVPVKGKITINGKPLPGALVSFLPDPGNKSNTPGTDETGPEGNYMIKFKSRTGLSPGKYTVHVNPPATLPGGKRIPEEFKDDPIMGQMSVGIGVPGSTVEKQLAKEITKKDFEAEVDASGGEFDFDVKATASSSAAAAAK
jgi:hypothetical protein